MGNVEDAPMGGKERQWRMQERGMGHKLNGKIGRGFEGSLRRNRGATQTARRWEWDSLQAAEGVEFINMGAHTPPAGGHPISCMCMERATNEYIAPNMILRSLWQPSDIHKGS